MYQSQVKESGVGRVEVEERAEGRGAQRRGEALARAQQVRCLLSTTDTADG